MDFTFDNYCIFTRADQYGDTGSSADDRTMTRTFIPNTLAWILGLHATKTMYEDLGTAVAARTGILTMAQRVAAPRPQINDPFKGN